MVLDELQVPPGSEVVFRGQDVSVISSLNSTSEHAVITFTSRMSDGTFHKEPAGAEFFRKKNTPAVHFISHENHWWQTKEMDEACLAVRKLKLHSQFASVATYGTSMGAHGAVLFSQALAADRVLAMGPQFAINGRNAPWKEDWFHDTRNRTEVYRMEDLAASQNVIICYDPFTSFDALHANAIRSSLDCEVLKVPFGGHPPARYLSSLKLLTPLVIGVVRGHFSRASFIKTLRAARRDNGNYLALLRSRSVDRRDTEIGAVRKG